MLTGSLSWGLESPLFFDHFDVATWVGATCLTAGRRASGAEIVALRLYQTMNKEYISYMPCIQRPFLLALVGGFCWD